jgi:aspartate/methionine/tyrosine aminotransferase
MRAMNGKRHIARRMADIQPFHVMDILARARALEAEGRDIVHMEIGEPDFPTPQPIIEAGHRALAEGRTHYTPAVGLPELREAISRFYQERYGVHVAASRIVITPGASGALQLVLATLVNPGEQVLMADPGYPCNRHFVRLVEGEPSFISTNADTHYQLTAESLRARWTGRSTAALIASPANPTGTLVPARELRAMAEFVAEQGGNLIVDEIYHGLVYDAEAPTALSVSDDVFVINSFSKYFGMTGWRLGWIVAPEAYVRDLDKLAQNLFLAASTPSQYAALAAFEPETIAILEERRNAFKARRDFLLPELRRLGFDIPVTPEGAFYLYANSERFGRDSFTLCQRLLDEAGVAITPGLDFGRHRASAHVRFAYTTDVERLREAVGRIEQFLAKG